MKGLVSLLFSVPLFLFFSTLHLLACKVFSNYNYILFICSVKGDISIEYIDTNRLLQETAVTGHFTLPDEAGMPF